MDVLVTNADDAKSTKLSDLGFTTLSFEESSPSIERTSKEFAGRNGSLDYGGRHAKKTVKITGIYQADSITDDQRIQERINGLLSGIDPYYITQMIGDGDIYGYERPGDKAGAVRLPTGTATYKRFLVYRSDSNVPDFKGKTGAGLLSSWELKFETVKLPYGESKPRSQALTSGQAITYNGTVACSQLEQAFYFVVTAKAASDTGFTLKVDGQTLEVNSPVVVGDVYTLSGMNNLRGNQNINSKTNAGYFVLKPDATNKVVCSIDATIQIKNLCDLYM